MKKCWKKFGSGLLALLMVVEMGALPISNAIEQSVDDAVHGEVQMDENQNLTEFEESFSEDTKWNTEDTPIPYNLEENVNLFLEDYEENITVYEITPHATSDETEARYVTLVLDRSGSMSGTPMTTMKASAINFCESLLNAEGDNYIALVPYGYSATVSVDFTDDLDILTTGINSLSAYGGTNISDGLTKAQGLLADIDDNHKKILLLLSDGIPESGSTSSTGKYTTSDHSSAYRYANVAYEIAESMWSTTEIYTLGFFHSLSGTSYDFAIGFMSDLANVRSYNVVDPEDLEFAFGDLADDMLNTGGGTKFYYNGDYSPDVKDGERTDSSNYYYYDDTYFFQPSTTYNPSLSTMSLCLELSTWSSRDETEWSLKSRNVQDLFENLGFDQYDQNDDVWDYAPTTNSIGVVAANKTIVDENDKEYTLVALSVRGGGYEGEWAGNAYLSGLDGKYSGLDHSGFTLGKRQVQTFLEEYIETTEITGDIKLWLVGYSRGAAVANLVAGEIDTGVWALPDGVSLAYNDLFCYLFATPQGAIDGDITIPGQNASYISSNIHNIININDIVPLVAPTVWGYDRYGSFADHILPNAYSMSADEFNEAQELMLSLYNTLDGAVGTYDIHDYYEVIEYSLYTNDSGYQSPSVVSGRLEALETIVLRSNVDILNYIIETISLDLIEDPQNYKIWFQDHLVRLIEIVYQEDVNREIFIDDLLEIVDEEIGWFDYLCLVLGTEDKEGEITSIIYDGLKKKKYSDDLSLCVKDLLLSIHDFTFIDFRDTAIATSNAISYAKLIKGSIFQAHSPEVMLAWLMSQDTNYTTPVLSCSVNPNYTVIHINCPVDVYVMEGNTVVASIQNRDASTIKNPYEDVNYISMNANDEIVVSLPLNSDYTISMEAYDAGEVNVTAEERSVFSSEIITLIDYASVSVTENETITLTSNQIDDVFGYTLVDQTDAEVAFEEFEANDIVTYTLTVESNHEYGFVTGSGSYTQGTFVALNGMTEENVTFQGWYQGDILLSTETNYRIEVTEDTTIIGKFSSSASSSSGSSSAGSSSSSSSSMQYYIYTQVQDEIGGSIKTSKSKAQEGTEITITVTPDEGYYLKSLQVLTEDGGRITAKLDEDSNYVFTMRDDVVTVVATFALGDSDTELEPDTDSEDDNVEIYPEQLFYDVKTSNWFYPYVKYALENGLMSGMGDGRFGAEVDTLRGMIVTVLHSIAEKPNPIQPTLFDDVTYTDYYFLASLWASEAGIVSGIGDNNFGGSLPVTREAICTMIYKYALTQTDLITGSTYVSSFVDGDDINIWAQEAVNWCSANKIVNGYDDGTFKPQASANRGEIATMLTKFSMLIK